MNKITHLFHTPKRLTYQKLKYFNATVPMTWTWKWHKQSYRCVFVNKYCQYTVYKFTNPFSPYPRNLCIYTMLLSWQLRQFLHWTL